MRAAVVALVLLVACGGADAQNVGSVSRGKAAWYGGKFQGRKTASGEKFDKRKLTAAHRKLPFGSKVRVTNLGNGKTVVVRINDRGPYGRGRIIDVSEAAAKKLGMLRAGIAKVKVEVLSRGKRKARNKKRRK
jgi:rare lipoprotein A